MIDDLLLSTDEKIKTFKNLPVEYLHKINPPKQSIVNDDCLELRQTSYRKNNEKTRLNMHFCGSAEPVKVKKSNSKFR